MTVDVDAAMVRALELAAAAQEWGDTPIGAVVLGPDRRRTPRCWPCGRLRGCTATGGG